MTAFVRLAGGAFLLLAAGGLAPAANQRDIDAAVKKGADYLRGRHAASVVVGTTGLGPTAMAGLALIEANVPLTDPALKNITATIREEAYTATSTYSVALAVFYLDRLGDPNDVPLIQALAGRLLVAQGPGGGWGYECITSVTPDVAKRLKAVRPLAPVAGADPKNSPPKLHPEIEAYYQSLPAVKNPANSEDNSNTQFGILAVWMARKHGVPTDAALDAIERRFLGTQGANGGWPYSVGNSAGSPSMTCAGLLGLATAVGRREERRLKSAAPPKEVAPAKTGAKAGDPFFNPPPPKDGEKKKGDAKRPAALDTKDVAVQAAFNNLAVALTAAARGPRGSLLSGEGGHGHYDLYFLWSLERVGVLFGADKIGGIDWYDFGADTLLPLQKANGSWDKNSYGADVDTAFAILFLQKANLARDLSSRIQKDPSSSELRAGAGSITGAPAVVAPMTKNATPAGADIPPAPVPSLPAPVDDETAKLATELVRATDWKKALDKFRDTKGGDYTKALTAAIYRLDADKKKQAREALAERLTRMTADTLRTMLKSEDAELRRGAALACAMKDDKAHVPDLIDKLADADDLVVRAAKAGLKSLTNQDFGPPAAASESQRQAAIVSWKDWWAKQKK